MGKRLLREPEAGSGADAAARAGELLEYARVVAGIGHDRDMLVVLGRAADHGRAADVDVLDRVGQPAIGPGDGFAEGIEIDGHEIDARDARLLQGFHVRARIAAGEYAAVHLRMQGLHPAVQHLGKTRVVRDLGHREPGAPQEGCGAAGRDQPDTQRRKPAREIDDAGLVGNAEERELDHDGEW